MTQAEALDLLEVEGIHNSDEFNNIEIKKIFFVCTAIVPRYSIDIDPFELLARVYEELKTGVRAWSRQSTALLVYTEAILDILASKLASELNVLVVGDNISVFPSQEAIPQQKIKQIRKKIEEQSLTPAENLLLCIFDYIKANEIGQCTCGAIRVHMENEKFLKSDLPEKKKNFIISDSLATIKNIVISVFDSKEKN